MELILYGYLGGCIMDRLVNFLLCAFLGLVGLLFGALVGHYLGIVEAHEVVFVVYSLFINMGMVIALTVYNEFTN